MSNRANQSVTPGRDRNAAIEQEGMGSYWQILDEIARIKFDEISEADGFARRVVTRHLHQLPTMRPNEEEGLIISFIRQFLDQTNGQASVEVAVVYLARSAWDVSLAIHRWIDPDQYEAIEKDEIWGDEGNDGSNSEKPPDIHETDHPVVQKSTTQPSVVRSAFPIQERRYNMRPNDANVCRGPASSTKGTIGSKQQDRSLVGSEDGNRYSHGESGAVAHASKGSISMTGTVARGPGRDGHEQSSGTSRQKPGPMNRSSLGKDADGDGKAGACANHTSEQSNPSIPQREIRPPAGPKTPNTSPEGSPETEHAAKFAALNPDLDRSPAILGESVPGKMKIQYQLPRTKAIKRLFFRQFNNGRNIDWRNIEHIRALNKWRTQVFRRMLGSTRNPGCSFHEEENEWLTERFRRHQETALRHGAEPDYHTLNWVAITKAFNDHFAGRTLPGCDIPRPLRTKGSITTQRYRIPAISKMTGVPLKRRKCETANMGEQELAEARDSDPEATGSEGSQEDEE